VHYDSGGQVTEYSKLSDFYYIKENALDKQFCEQCIIKFKKDTGGGVIPEIKQSRDINISEFDHWKEEDAVFFASLNTAIAEYRKLHINKLLWLNIRDYKDYGYQIQETLPGGFYKWHHDFYSRGTESRFLTYLWYLNDIDEGGHTEFIDGTMIKPETGKLILFPAAWPFYHQGTPPVKEKKYICTGWIYIESSFINS